MAGWYPDFLPGEKPARGRFSVRPLGISRLMNNRHHPARSAIALFAALRLYLYVEEEVAFGPENLCLAEEEIRRGLMPP